MSAKKILAVLLVPAVLVGGYFSAEWGMLKASRHLVQELADKLPAGTAITYSGLESSLISGRISLEHVELVQKTEAGALKVSAQKVDFLGRPWLFPDMTRFGSVLADHVVVHGAAEARFDRVVLNDFGLRTNAAQSQVTSVSLDNLRFSSAKAESVEVERKESSLLLKAASLNLGELKSGRFDSVEVNNIHFTSSAPSLPRMHLVLAALKLSDADLFSIFSADGQIDLGALILTGVVNGAQAQGIDMWPEGGQDHLTIDDVVFKGDSLSDGTRTLVDLSLNNFVLPLNFVTSPAREFYQGIGYQAFHGNARIAGAYDPANATIVLKDGSVAVRDFGNFGAKGMVTGVSGGEELLKGLIDGQFMLASVSLSSLHLSFEDKGLVPRYIEAGAKELMVSKQVYLEQIINKLRLPTGAAGGGVVRLSEAFLAFSSFVMNPGTLALDLAPEKPMPLLQIYYGLRDPASLTETLKFSLTNTPPAVSPSSQGQESSGPAQPQP